MHPSIRKLLESLDNIILREYSRDLTRARLGDKLLRALAQINDSYVPEHLSSYAYLLKRAAKPESANDSVTLKFNNRRIRVTPENVQSLAQRLAPQALDLLLTFFESRDTTPNKQFVAWLINTFIKNPNDVRMEDYNAHDLLGLFQKYKQRVPEQLRDINQFTSYSSFVNKIWPLGLQSIGARTLPRGESTEKYRDGEVRVIIPHDKAAACYYGQATRWCTAATRGENDFETYNSQGPLYMVLPRRPDYKDQKYQLHFPTEQFTNEQNTNIDLLDLLDRFEGLRMFLLDETRELKRYIIFTADDELEQIMDYVVDAMMAQAKKMTQRLGRTERRRQLLDELQSFLRRRKNMRDIEGSYQNNSINPTLNNLDQIPVIYGKFLKQRPEMQDWDELIRWMMEHVHVIGRGETAPDKKFKSMRETLSENFVAVSA